MDKRKIIREIDDVLNKVTDVALSAVLPTALRISKHLNDKEFEKWLLLEISGYFETNPALTDDTIVPDYRKVPGQFHDKYGRPLIIDNPKLFEINNYPIREGIDELEENSKKEKFLSFRNPTAMAMMKKVLNVEVDTFTYSSNSLKPIINEVRNRLISWLVENQKEFSNSLIDSEVNPNVPVELIHLHPVVQNTAGELFANGHYRQAILDTYITIVEAVKTKSGNYELDNTPLMQTIFSPKSPTIKVSDDMDEQLGFMWLFSGAVMGIRNPNAHRIIEQNDPQQALEWLSFASALMRIIDSSALIQEDNKKSSG